MKTKAALRHGGEPGPRGSVLSLGLGSRGLAWGSHQGGSCGDSEGRYSLSSLPTPTPRRPAEDHAQSHRVFCLGRHRHHRRDLRQLDPGAVPEAQVHGMYAGPSSIRSGQGLGGAGRDQPQVAEHEGKRPIVFITLVNDDIRRVLILTGDELQGHGAGHVPHLRRAAGSRVRRQVQPPHRPLLRRRQERGVPRADRRHQLLACAHDDGQIVASNLEIRPTSSSSASAAAARRRPSLYLAMQHGIKAANYPLIPRISSAASCRRRSLPHRTSTSASACRSTPQRLSQIRNERRPGQQVRVAGELPLRGGWRPSCMMRKRREHRLGSVFNAQVDRGDRHHHPARHPA